MTPRPSIRSDEEARRQAAEDLDRNLFVEAAAGTGKTSILVRRIVNIVQSGRARLTEVAAITFTEKAAGELLHRVRAGLAEALEEEPLDPGERERLEQALLDVERSPISTIHGLAGQLLRERPVEAGLDPRFTPLDEIGAGFEREEAWEAWLPGALAADPEPARRALLAGVGLTSIRKLAEFLLAHRDRARPEALPAGPPPDVDGFLARWEETQAALSTLVRSCRDPSDGASETIQRLARTLAEARALKAGGERGRLEALLRALEIKFRDGSQESWRPKEDCKRAKEILKGLAGERQRLLEALNHAMIAGLVGWLLEFTDFALERLRARGLLTFQDYLIECRDLLRRDREVRGFFQRRFKALLLDEFQDTDPLQVEIVFFLAEESPVAATWKEVKLAPGKLFIVGDPKQSIYRFRRADIELYEEVKARLKESGGAPAISRNFRSVPGAIEWVNATFGALIRPPADGGRYQPEYSPLLPHREGDGRPAVQDLKTSKELETADQGRREEAERLGDLIADMARSGTRYGDIGVLFPKSSGIEIYEDSLRSREIPYSLDGGKEFFRREEVAGILNCLDALERPEDEIALVGALKSSIFGHADLEVLRLVASGGRLSYLADPPGALAGEPLASSLAVLRQLHAERNRRPMSATVARLVNETGAGAAAALRRKGGLGASQNLKKLISFARRFDAEGSAGATFGRFARWLRRMAADESREAESPAFEESEDVVRLLTVHKSKGLEFPVVVLINLGTDDSRGEKFLWVGDRLEVRLGPSEEKLQTRGFEGANEGEKLREQAERVRLLYVAATRARDRLVISRIASRRQRGDLQHLMDHPAPEEVRPPPAPPAPEDAGSRGEADIEEAIARGFEEVRGRPERIRRNYRPPVLVRPSGEGEEGEPAAHGAFSGAGGSGREAAQAFGTAVHRLLQSVDLAASRAELSLLAAAAAAEAGVPERAPEVLDHAARVLGSDLCSRVRRSARLWREVPLQLLMEDSRILSGKIDLVFEEDGRYTIVDYKTDRLRTKADLAARAAGYGEQLRLYAHALGKVTGHPVREAVLLFTALGTEHSVKL